MDSDVRSITDAQLGEAKKLLRQGRPEDALGLVSRLLEAVPADESVTALADACGLALERECLRELGSPSAVLRVAMPADEWKKLELDPVSAFFLSLVDGVVDVETIVDISGRPRLVSLRQLRGLLARGLVTSDSPPT